MMIRTLIICALLTGLLAKQYLVELEDEARVEGVGEGEEQEGDEGIEEEGVDEDQGEEEAEGGADYRGNNGIVQNGRWPI